MTEQDLIDRPNKELPISQEAEEAVLGSILINPDAYFEVSDFLSDKHFFIVRNAWVWLAIKSIVERGDHIDNLTVIEELRHRDQLESIGGSAYVTYLINNTPTHIHAETYGRMVERAAIRRQLLAGAGVIAQLALEENAEIKEVLRRAESILFGISAGRVGGMAMPLGALVSSYYDDLRRRCEAGDHTHGYPTLFTDYDRLIGGFKKTELAYIAARPGVGKTTLMLNLMLNFAQQGIACLFFSLEMSKENLTAKMIAARNAIDTRDLDRAYITDEQWDSLTNFLPESQRLPIYIEESRGWTITQIRTKAKQWLLTHPEGVIFLDYVQLVHGDKRLSREQEISGISQALKELALECNIPVISAAQLSRAVEQREDKVPVLSDLRESGDLENACDVAIFIYRDDLNKENSDRPNQADIIVRKNRNGPLGWITLYVRPEVSLFTSMVRHTINLPDLVDPPPAPWGYKDEGR